MVWLEKFEFSEKLNGCRIIVWAYDSVTDFPSEFLNLMKLLVVELVSNSLESNFTSFTNFKHFQ